MLLHSGTSLANPFANRLSKLSRTLLCLRLEHLVSSEKELESASRACSAQDLVGLACWVYTSRTLDISQRGLILAASVTCLGRTLPDAVIDWKARSWL
jgi:hypothetical protein